MRKTKVQQSKKVDKKLYYILVIVAIVGYVYTYFISPKTIGLDYRYTLVVNLMPILIGVIILAYLRRSFLISNFLESKKIGIRIFMVCWFTVQGILFSFFSFGLVAKMIWDYTNFLTTKNKVTFTIDCPVDRFWCGKKCKIEFYYKKNYEYIEVSKSTLNFINDIKEEDYYLKLKGKSGCWNCFIVEEWSVEEK